MFLRDNADVFINSQDFAENTRTQYLRMLTAIGTYESKIEIPLYRMSPDDMYNGFSVVTKNADRIRKLRSLVEQYFNWLSESGADVSVGRKSLLEIEKKSVEYISTLQYFYSIHHLMAKTRHDMEYVSNIEGKSPEDYRMPHCAFILAWYGIKLEDALLIDKEDILRSPGFFTFNGKITEVDSAAYDVLRECATADGYTKGVNVYLFYTQYCKTDKLFCTDVKEMSIKAMRESILGINVKLRGKSTPYNINRIYWSGKFSRAYIFEMNGGLEGVKDLDKRKIFENLFGETYTTRLQYNDRQREYELYKTAFNRR